MRLLTQYTHSQRPDRTNWVDAATGEERLFEKAERAGLECWHFRAHREREMEDCCLRTLRIGQRGGTDVRRGSWDM